MKHGLSPLVTVSLDALLGNVAVLRTFLPATVSIIAVVKDSSYGCGSVRIATTLQAEAGIDHFAVASADEAFHLRKNGINGTVIIFGKVEPHQLHEAAARRCTLTLSDLQDLQVWRQCDLPISFHVEIDSGMRRMGIVSEAVPALLDTLQKNPRFVPDGIFTHFASADVPGTGSVDRQRSIFLSAIARFRERGFTPRVIHTSNSAAIMRFCDGEFTHVRPGIALYGCQPDPDQMFSAALQPVVTLEGYVVSIRTVNAGTAVSYGGHYVTDRQTCIATVAIGYAHGIPRYLSNRGSVLIGEIKYRIAGNVTMDYCMIDAGPSPHFSVGDRAIFIGRQGSKIITPDDIARTGRTIGYEVLCNIGPNVRRIYMLHGKPVDETGPYIY